MSNCFYSYFFNSKKRIDHNPMYMCVMVWDLFAGAYGIAIGLPDTAMTRMTHYSSSLICWLMFAGGFACVTGMIMGTKFDLYYCFHRLFRKKYKVDLRKSYIFGILGHPMLMISFYYYSIAILVQMPWASTQASEASLALFVGIGCTINLIRFILEINHINSKLPGLINQEIDMRISEAGSNE